MTSHHKFKWHNDFNKLKINIINKNAETSQFFFLDQNKLLNNHTLNWRI